ncbi:hypothetical protein DID78_06190 [Candidatus Marinamargulisbacteria bacterium SCGC AG-343-D04]|nr:hypothetical protein DID78_06190 [Candidatus Marinamargulisbacteria bacterium SCGC AG-343-D04]
MSSPSSPANNPRSILKPPTNQFPFDHHVKNPPKAQSTEDKKAKIESLINQALEELKRFDGAYLHPLKQDSDGEKEKPKFIKTKVPFEWNDIKSSLSLSKSETFTIDELTLLQHKVKETIAQAKKERQEKEDRLSQIGKDPK